MNKNEQIKGISGLKGIAACIIAFVWHYQHFAGPEVAPFKSILPILYSYGYLMVELFFILSGFGIMSGYSERIMNHEISFPVFISRRIKKIYPLFFATTIIVVILEALYYIKMGSTFVYPNYDIFHLILNLLFIQDGLVGTEWSLNSPSWCISICVVCYSLVYALIYHSKNKHEMIYKFIISACLGVALIASKENYPILNSLMGRGIANFFIGALIYELYTHKSKFQYKRVGYLCVFFLVMAFIIIRFMSMEFVGNVQLAFTLGLGPMLLMSVLFLPVINKVFGCKLFVFLGEISLGIYLFHFPVQCIIRVADIYFDIGINYASDFFWIGYAASVIAVSALYRFFVQNKYENSFLKFFSVRNAVKNGSH